ncbi:hypothetical protein Cgig2_008319 [Carnegiea gigantea]|uniref:Uncharacterized protein n=1 Tax=Carnegiea gigantea TaxID=171969 RepID=A0A9Q1JTW3_9CARY|nr:hypothetical protein Cgig2_008319 [Carnegiea gigantea]
MGVPGESISQFNGDNSTENNENEGGYDSDEVNMLEDTYGAAGMGLGLENEKDIEQHIHEQPTEANVVKMVQNVVRKSDKDNDFVDDGDIEVFYDSSEEEEEQFDYDMSHDETYTLDMTNQTDERNRTNVFTRRVTVTSEVQEIANPCEVEVDPRNANFECGRLLRRASVDDSTNSTIDGNVGNNECKFTNLLITYKLLLLCTILIR